MNGFKIAGGTVEIWRDSAEISRRAAEMFTGIAREAIAERGRFDVALSGGTTPRLAYELLASEEYSTRVDWPRVQVFWSDERCVAPDNEQSNYLLAAEAMLNHLPIEPDQIHRMHGEDDAGQAAAAYEAELRNHFGSDEPRFDLIYLGLGDDGHTASLFPGSAAVDDLEHLIAAPFVEKFQTHRLTMTLRMINAAAQVIFLTAGAAKANILREVLRDGENGATRVPARLVRPTNGDLLWLVDEAAAAKL